MAIPDADFACGDEKYSKRATFNPFVPCPTFADAASGKLRGAGGRRDRWGGGGGGGGCGVGVAIRKCLAGRICFR